MHNWRLRGRVCTWGGWHKNGQTRRAEEITNQGPADQLLVLSGSCSPVTERQIQWGLQNEYYGVHIDTEALVNPNTRESEFQRVVVESVRLLKRSNDLIIYSALGPDDKMIERTKDALKRYGMKGQNPSHILGGLQSEMLKCILEQTSVNRVVVAGGDTSGHILKDLDVFALEVVMPLTSGAPLCLVHSTSTKFDGLEIVLKGGQIGDESFFNSIKNGECGP